MTNRIMLTRNSKWVLNSKHNGEKRKVVQKRQRYLQPTLDDYDKDMCLGFS